MGNQGLEFNLLSVAPNKKARGGGEKTLAQWRPAQSLPLGEAVSSLRARVLSPALHQPFALKRRGPATPAGHGRADLERVSLIATSMFLTDFSSKIRGVFRPGAKLQIQ